ncbi:MAG: RnfABCDGE type electron transport complex subunit D [Spirochaetota bacterium]
MAQNAKPAKKQPLIRWHKPNNGVMIALIPVIIFSIYTFGWRSLVMLAVVTAAGFLTEYLFLRAYYKEPVTSAVFVSSFLFTLTLPPTLPLWIAVVGIVFGIAIGKMAFGGFGRNVFNPALTGRAFIFVSFGGPMTAAWVENLSGIPGGFGAFAADAVTAATPMMALAQGDEVPLLSMLLGNESGCLGETSALLILAGGVYILWKKYANWRIVASGFLGMLLLQTAFWAAGVQEASDPLAASLGGGWMLGVLFMATDPISAAATNPGRWIYGGLIGALTSLIRTFSIWSGGMMFAILLGNMFAPIIDHYVRQAQAKRREAGT